MSNGMLKKYYQFELGQVCSRLSSGKGIAAKEISEHGIYPVFGGNGLRGYSDKKNFEGQCAIIGRQGAFCGNVRFFSGEAYMTEHAVVVCANEKSDIKYLSYLLGTMNLGRLSGQSAQPGLSVKTLSKQVIQLPDISEQRQITKVLSSFDDKIELNAQINHNLEEQAKALYDQIWDNYDSGTWSSAKAEDLFDISIGKTPPRKESQWFSENDNDIVWVSIADMGQSGCFISNSSEYLTPDAVSKFNVKRVPAGAILLSFKLTVGRVAITGCELTTNEAIAHFRMEDSTIREYLYFYLKHFNYQTMGSTSSIATAVNSKMVKAMRIDIPARETLENFHSTVFPMFEQIEQNHQEIQTLAQLRDTLLPKLMSGELDVSEVEV